MKDNHISVLLVKFGLSVHTDKLAISLFTKAHFSLPEIFGYSD
ncbi:6837_t:CDS:1, partial [Racocetra persica]